MYGSVMATRTPVLPVYTRILVQYIGYSLLGNSYKPPLFFTGIPYIGKDYTDRSVIMNLEFTFATYTYTYLLSYFVTWLLGYLVT